jgi:modulator of FtsH protease
MNAITSGWANFFVAEAGAAAALSGLIFVAVSINLSRIIAIRHLPERAGETLLVLLMVLTVATFGLVPEPSRTVLGAEVAGAGLLVWGWASWVQWRAHRDPDLVAREWLWLRVLGTQLSSIPFVVAGALLLFGGAHALAWIVPGTIASFASGMLNAWVLLVEILR